MKDGRVLIGFDLGYGPSATVVGVWRSGRLRVLTEKEIRIEQLNRLILARGVRLW